MMAVLLFLFFTILVENFADIVKIDQGLINGTVLKSRDGTPYQAFYAIPYAQPPVGELRFKPPAEAPTWAGVRQAQTKGPVCIQSNSFDMKAPMSGTEDCLYLSVFTRELQPHKLVPVMIFIHGGAFCMGSGDSNDVHPLMDKSVVVVTINYRVGIFGFLSSSDEIIPGNFGLKDQTAALKWVQKNIKYFGGDPQSVTIFGESAGSASIHFHLISPLSKGLYHKAILESGSGTSLWAYYDKENNTKTYVQTMKRTSCNSTSSVENLKCFQTLSDQYLWQVEKELKSKESSMIKYRPTIENAGQPGAFLTGDPHTVSYQDPSIPIIMGFNSAEGLMDTIPILIDNKNMTILEEKLDEIIAKKLYYYYTTSHEEQINITKMIRKFYLTDGVMAKGQEQNLCNIFSDFIFVMPIIDVVMKYPGPKYTYLYDYRHAVSMIYKLNITLKDLGLQGAGHAEELMDFFYKEKLSPLLSPEDIEFSKKLITYWTNFAYSGNPNNNESVPQYWKAAEVDPLNYLFINNTIFTMKTGPLAERYKFWQTCPLTHQYGKLRAVTRT